MEETGCIERPDVTVKPICMEILKGAYVNILLFDFLEMGKLNLKETSHLLPCFVSEST